MNALNSFASGTKRAPFPGFEHLTANFLYCPNQFLDVCIPNCSRGTVRLVAYLLRRTLGWLDEDGKPIEQEITVSYRELTQDAGISRGSLREAIEEATACGFIVCTQQGSAKAKCSSHQHSRFTLHWDGSGEYTKILKEFAGFFRGNGNRTPIPNAFFDSVIPQETHAVLKVVGTVLRHTVGYENQFGVGRRKQAPLSYSYIQRFGNIKTRKSVSQALKRAIETGYIQCVGRGRFHADGNEQSTATYAVRWLSENRSPNIGSKKIPGDLDRFKKDTNISSKTVPGDRFKKDTSRKTVEKNTFKQQMSSVVVDFEEVKLLKQAGFLEKTATKLAQHQSLDVIQQQIEWIEHRRPQDNRLGMLRCAIEENWSEPVGIKKQYRAKQAQQNERDQDAKREVVQMALRDARFRKQQQRAKQIIEFHRLSEKKKSKLWSDAITEETNTLVCSRLQRNRDFENPPDQVLALLAS